jgi:hypothetical protein
MLDLPTNKPLVFLKEFGGLCLIPSLAGSDGA